jgi:hypothetical protein
MKRNGLLVLVERFFSISTKINSQAFLFSAVLLRGSDGGLELADACSMPDMREDIYSQPWKESHGNKG